MLFNSFAFAVFLPIVFALYWILPQKYRWALLLVASYYFYMSWNVKYVVLILLTTVISYFTALLIAKETRTALRKLYLGIDVAVCLGFLFFYKYFNFFSENVMAFFRLFFLQLHPVTLNLILPVGISFYTFQTMSYVIDVYRGVLAPEKHFGIFATFISFFPQLVAGPIERASNLLPQIREEHHFTFAQGAEGLKIMAWGFFKKIVVADTLCKYVDSVYATPQSYSGFPLLLATFFFAIQIYCDFSGYSQIAIGAAKLFGINLMENFRSPYFSTSEREFWNRWHISLSSWLRDYVYIPLGGNRVSKARHAMNTLATFTLSGLWHGANWTYVIWGALHGVALVVENAVNGLKQLCKRVPSEPPPPRLCLKRCLQAILVFLFGCFAWIFFRAESLADAGYVISNMFAGLSSPLEYFIVGMRNIHIGDVTAIIIAGLLLAVGLFDFFSLKYDLFKESVKLPKLIKWLLYYGIVGAVIMFTLYNGAEQQFVYFQF